MQGAIACGLTVRREFVFRFNRRNTPMAAFQTLLGISTRKAPLPLQNLVVLS